MKVILLANWGLGLEILKTLHRMSDVEIALVVTQYKKESTDPWFNAVYDFACEQGYKTMFQESISFGELREYVVKLEIDLLISHAFMRIFPREVFTKPRYGSINIHPSLLPKYRGPSPTYWVLKNNEKVTGLTCHYMDEGIDTGDIINQVEVVVEPHDTMSSIIEKQKGVLPEFLRESLSFLRDKNLKATSQKERLASYAPKPEQKEGLVN